MRTIVINLFRALANSYGMSVWLFLILRFLVGDSWAFVAFFTTFSVWTWLPAIVLLPIALLTRSWWSAAMVTPAIVALVWVYGGQFLPRSTPTTPPTLTILTYNIYADGRSPQASLDIILKSGADIVALQEYSQGVQIEIETTLADLYPYQATHVTASDTQGQAIFSKFPILSDDYWQYEWLPLGKLGQQRVEIDQMGQSIVVYNSHPTHPGMQGRFFDPAWRGKEIEDLLQRTTAETLPLIWVGDFNMPDQSTDYNAITTHFSDSYREAGWGFGFTYRFSFIYPIIRLDYVFHSATFRAVSAEVLPNNGGSDHYPLKVGLLMQ